MTTSRMKPRSALAAMHDQNVMSAEIIQANPQKYQGLMAEWAAAILANEARRVNNFSEGVSVYGRLRPRTAYA